MKKLFLYANVMLMLISINNSCASGNKNNFVDDSPVPTKINHIIYFNPEVYPDLEEIKPQTYDAFFSAATDQVSVYGNYKILRINETMKSDSINTNFIKELCVNNNSQIAVVSKVKYFKVGLGEYVFSNQVLISLHLYNADGQLLLESNFDTYKGRGRLLGTTENSVKIGTKNAIEKMMVQLRKTNLELYRELKKTS